MLQNTLLGLVVFYAAFVVVGGTAHAADTCPAGLDIHGRDTPQKQKNVGGCIFLLQIMFI